MVSSYAKCASANSNKSKPKLRSESASAPVAANGAAGTGTATTGTTTAGTDAWLAGRSLAASSSSQCHYRIERCAFIDGTGPSGPIREGFSTLVAAAVGELLTCLHRWLTWSACFRVGLSHEC